MRLEATPISIPANASSNAASDQTVDTVSIVRLPGEAGRVQWLRVRLNHWVGAGASERSGQGFIHPQ